MSDATVVIDGCDSGVANTVFAATLPPRGTPGTGTQQRHNEGMPFGTRGGMSVEHTFLADGEYELTIGDLALARAVEAEQRLRRREQHHALRALDLGRSRRTYPRDEATPDPMPLWPANDPDAWRRALDSYESVIAGQGVARHADLERWYPDHRPAAIAQRNQRKVTPE